MSTECENDQHADCADQECACGCHGAIAAALERSLGTVTTRPLPTDQGDGGASNWLADRRQRSYYGPSGDVDLYHPTGPQSTFESLGMLPHEISDIEDEQASRQIAAGRLRALFRATYQRAGLPVPPTLRPRRPRRWWASLLGAIRLSR